MDLNKFDIVLMFTMTLAIILMSFTFPALGLTDESDETSESDIPELNISSSSWDIVGDFPRSPGTPTSGTIERDDSKTVIGEHQAWIDRPKSDGTVIEIISFSGDHQIVYNNFTGGTAVAQDFYNITESGQEIRHSNESWDIIFQVESYENANQANASSVVNWEIVGSPNADEGGGLSAIPVIGGLFDVGEQVFLALAFLGDIIIWAVGSFLEIAIAAANVLFTAMVYAIDMVTWLSTTYSSIISAAPGGFASGILALPGVLLALELLKMAMLGIKLLPTT